ncbi:MAG: hypothetical protein DMD69_18610, partial [Gemmatimonadetes bacterium]
PGSRARPPRRRSRGLRPSPRSASTRAGRATRCRRPPEVSLALRARPSPSRPQRWPSSPSPRSRVAPRPEPPSRRPYR